MTKLDDTLEDLLRTNQIDLGALPRDRLEDITHGLLLGQIRVIEALAAETRQSRMIEAQHNVILGLQAALDRATSAFVEPTPDERLRSILVGMLETHPDPQALEVGLVRAYRMLELEGIELSEEATKKWATWGQDAVSEKTDSGHQMP